MLSKALLGFSVPDNQPSMTAHHNHVNLGLALALAIALALALEHRISSN